MTSESCEVVHMQEIARKKILGDVDTIQEYLSVEAKKGRHPSNALQQLLRKMQGLPIYEQHQK